MLPNHIAILALVGSFFVINAIPTAMAQGAGGSDAENGANQADAVLPPNELLKELKTTPASKMDLGLLAVETREIAYFTINKPDVLKKDRFRFLAAEYIDSDDNILVQVSHLSPNKLPARLAAECRDDIELEVGALVRTKMKAPFSASDESLLCRSITSSFFGSEDTGQWLSREVKHSDDNLCRHIRFYARVSSMNDGASVHCFRDFFSSDVEVTHEEEN